MVTRYPPHGTARWLVYAVLVRLLITDIGRLWVGDGDVLTDAAVLFDGDRIGWVGSRVRAPAADEVTSCRGGLVTPGLVDAHAHPVYAGDRHAEIARRSAGAGYAEIATAGGGIAATVRDTRAAVDLRLAASVRDRLRSWLRTGTTTVECKTGYHLTGAGELAAVRLLAGLADESDQPDLARPYVTFLAAHAVPPEYAGRQSEYAALCGQWTRPAAEAGARGVDVFCDTGYFTVAEARAVLLAGRAAGLVPRVHADELARTGGAMLAAELGAASADHLLRVTQDDARALAGAGVVATLCPLTGLQLRRQPPARMLADAGVRLALGTDHNPGQCGSTSMSLVVAVAVAALGLTVAEALTAATAGSAAALRLTDRGVVRVGALADLVWWDADHEGAFAWAFGLSPLRVWRGGQPVERAASSLS
ncbi:MAG TPA: imidazolonepropionase [Mycobacteriales bacterium]|nr:imidazolonepropionase [Mycobacteriales bacterium]